MVLVGFRDSVHDILVRDLVHCAALRMGGAAGRTLAVSEVTVGSVRFDAVAVEPGHGAMVFEVKVRRLDALDWIRKERWKDGQALGADVGLAFPEGLLSSSDLPRDCGVRLFTKLHNGSWDRLRYLGHAGKRVSVDLLFGVIAALRRELWYSRHINSVGESVAAAMLRMAAAELPATGSDS